MTIRQILKELSKLTSFCIDYNNCLENYYITTSTTMFNTFVSYNTQLWHKTSNFILSLDSIIINIDDDKITVNNKIETYKQNMFDKIYDCVKLNP